MTAALAVETRDQNEIREWIENSSDVVASQIAESSTPAPTEEPTK